MVFSRRKINLISPYQFSLYKLSGGLLGIVILTGATALALIILRSERSSRQPITRRDCEADGEFAFINAGEFVTGSDRTERDYGYRISAQAAAESEQAVPQVEQRLRQKRWFAGELQRQVHTLPAFCLSRNLVTNAQYQTFIQVTGHRSPGISEAAYQTQGFLVHAYATVQPYLWQGDRFPANEANYPVVLVSHKDAQTFANWKSQQDGTPYRLPTAAEWEKAARGTTGRYFPWGNQWQAEATNWAGSGRDRISPVGAYPLSRSSYGVEDMAGNVFEYTSTLTSRGGQTQVVMKGCSWDDLPGFCRAAYRHTRPVDSKHILFGFRLVRE